MLTIVSSVCEHTMNTLESYHDRYWIESKSGLRTPEYETCVLFSFMDPLSAILPFAIIPDDPLVNKALGARHIKHPLCL